MKKAILGLLVGLFLLGLVAGGSNIRQLDDEIDAVQQQWLVIKASPPGKVTVAQARALWLQTYDLERRYADNPRVKSWENRTWYTYRDSLRQADWASWGGSVKTGGEHTQPPV